MKTKEVKYQEARDRNWRSHSYTRRHKEGPLMKTPNVVFHVAKATSGKELKSHDPGALGRVLSAVKHKLGIRRNDETYDAQIMKMILPHSTKEK